MGNKSTNNGKNPAFRLGIWLFSALNAHFILYSDPNYEGVLVKQKAQIIEIKVCARPTPYLKPSNIVWDL